MRDLRFIVYNNAGVALHGLMEHATFADWDWIMGVNIGGVINGVMTFLPRMLAAAVPQVLCRFEAIDGNGLLPLRVPERAYPTAYAFRRFLQARLPDSATTCFWRSIAVAPWPANTYHDVGIALLGEDRVDLAWLAFDLGRAVDPTWRDGVMSTIADAEQRLETTLPDFF